MKLSSVVPTVATVIILLPIAFSVVWAVASPGDEGAQPFLVMPEREEACIEDTAYMRFQHMDLLLDLRDEVVREGSHMQVVVDGQVRQVTLDGCWDCHTDRTQFCNRCHDSVNLNLNCFKCHHDPSSELSASEIAHLSFNRGDK